MNRHHGLDRRVPLKRSSAGRRSGRLPASSTKRKAERRDHVDIVLRVFERDGFACRARSLDFGPCFGPLTPHHLQKSSQGGKTTLTNVITLCSAHNDRVEDEPARARELGLVTYSWEIADV